MLIPFKQVNQFILSNGKEIQGILHIGAHHCEERYDYNMNGITDDKIIWIEGNNDLVQQNKQKSKDINIYHVLVDNEEKDVTFNITNNGQSSSILELGTHKESYPYIFVSEQQQQRTMRLDSFFEQNNIDPSKYDFWNLDIQGTELSALKSAEKYLKYVNYIYTEVNTQEVYKGCALLPELDEYLAKYGFMRVGINLVKDAGWGDAVYFRVSPTS